MGDDAQGGRMSGANVTESPAPRAGGLLWGRFTWFGVGVALAATALIDARAADGPDGIRFEEIAKRAGVQLRHHSRMFKGDTGDVLRMFTSGGAAVHAKPANDNGNVVANDVAPDPRDSCDKEAMAVYGEMAAAGAGGVCLT